MPDPIHPDDPKTIGKPAPMFDTDEIRPIQAPAAPVLPPAASDGYDLEGYHVPEAEEPPRPVPIPSPPVERPKSGPKAPTKLSAEMPGIDESGSTEFVTELSEVDPVWTRMGEWGPDLYPVVGVGVGTLFLSWLTWNWGPIGFLVLLAGGVATVLRSYPLLITLERPVRITPEQAVIDFYAAASHHFPHYRRMWLLLSVVGRESGNFRSFEAFRDYWRAQIERWRREGGVGKYAPLKFEVDAFRSDKSTGKETSRADYTVNVLLRDREDAGPVATFKMAHGLVKGPDRMWYLNRGVLDRASR